MTTSILETANPGCGLPGSPLQTAGPFIYAAR
jgi:hypothetical protein